MDLSLAPVAAEIDSNLERLRDKVTAEEINAEFQIEINRPATDGSREERVNHVLEFALRNVDLHGWDAAITDDAARLRLSGGSVSLDLGLSASILRYIENGLP